MCHVISVYVPCNILYNIYFVRLVHAVCQNDTVACLCITKGCTCGMFVFTSYVTMLVRDDYDFIFCLYFAMHALYVLIRSDWHDTMMSMF